MKQTKNNGITFDFRLNLVNRHFVHSSTHELGSSSARSKKEAAQEEIKSAMAAAMADNCGNASYNIFNRPSFQHFLHLCCEYSKNYRENPDTFLSFEAKSMMRLVDDRSTRMMAWFKEAINHSIEHEQMMIRQSIDTGDDDLKKIPRVVFSLFLDYKWFGYLKKTLGAVTMAARIYDKENKSKDLIEIPLDLFSLDEDGTTADANSRHFQRVLEEFFEKEHIRFLGSSFDGGILDKNKSNLLPLLAELGYSNFEITSFSCACHGNALQPPLSLKRIHDDYGLSFESGADPNPQRFSVEAIWFGNGDEKNKNENNILTFHNVMKELGKRTKRRQINYGDYVELLRFEDDRNKKKSSTNEDDRSKEKTSRTNSVHLRWKSHYFGIEAELPKECPLKIIRMSDKKLRRTHQKVIRVLDNYEYIKIGFQHPDYKKFFPENPNMDGDFQNMLGQWAGLACYLWSLNDNSKEGFNCSTFRSLLIVLAANLEDSVHTKPLDNFFLRYVIFDTFEK